MSDTTTITQEKIQSWRERLTSEFSCFNAELGGFTLRLLDALEQAEARAEKAEKELAGADAEIAELRDELEDSRGTEKDAPNVLCAIARLVGVYEHSQELGDDMGTLVLEAVSDLLAEKQKNDPRALRWTHEPPKVAGWYWCRLSRLNMPRCVEVYGSEDGLRFGSGDNWREPSMSVESEGFEWAGPIPLPVEG